MLSYYLTEIKNKYPGSRNCADLKKGITPNITPKENTYNIVWISQNYDFTELWDRYYK